MAGEGGDLATGRQSGGDFRPTGPGQAKLSDAGGYQVSPLLPLAAFCSRLRAARRKICPFPHACAAPQESPSGAPRWARLLHGPLPSNYLIARCNLRPVLLPRKAIREGWSRRGGV